MILLKLKTINYVIFNHTWILKKNLDSVLS
jgi:hypothetical protein